MEVVAHGFIPSRVQPSSLPKEGVPTPATASPAGSLANSPTTMGPVKPTENVVSVSRIEGEAKSLNYGGALGTDPKQSKPRAIKILSEQCYNRIGSEQVIVNPSLIVKELVENSIDAKAKSVNVVLEGNKTFDKIKVKDDGYGIPKDNLPLLCKRFSTTKFDDDYDFAQICSLGYRGEALNFVSLNAKVTISSKSINSKCGFKAEYRDGVIQAPSKSHSTDAVVLDPSQGQGTKIEVSEIFFNNVKRRDDLNFIKDSEEIVKLVWKLAFHYRNTFFSVSRNENLLFKNEFIQDEKTYFLGLVNFRFNKRLTLANFTLQEKSIEDEHFKVKMFFSDPNIDLPKKTCIVFVNGRLCKIEAFKKAASAAYKSVNTSVNESVKAFFCYLDLQLDTSVESNYLDVNSCPKKQNIVLRNHEKIIEYVKCTLERLLRENRSTITYNPKGLPPGSLMKKEESGNNTGPVMERSDPNRIKLTSAFSEIRADREIVGTLTNSVSEETKRDFLTGLVKYSEIFLDFFKKVEIVGVKNAYTLLIQYETMLLSLDTQHFVRKYIEYKMLIQDQYNVTGTVTINLNDRASDLLLQGIGSGFVNMTKPLTDEQGKSTSFMMLKENEGLLSFFGCSLDGELLQIKTFDFLDYFDFYQGYFYFFLLKICSGCGTPREAAELLGYYFLLNLEDYLQVDQGRGGRLESVRAYYDLLVLEAKREEFCTEIEFDRDLDPIVDLEHTYKTFERC